MKTSVVILNYNGKEMLKKYLPTLIQYTPNAELWVADNASTDGSVEMLQTDFPQIKVINLEQNYGFAQGYNYALRKISTEYAVLLNSDIEVTEDWLRPLEDFMEEHPDCAACQPKIKSIKDRDKFEYAGAAGGFIDKYGYPFCRGRIFDTIESDKGQYDDICQITWASGAAMMVRMTDYRNEGGLDGNFFAHNEEIDLCWRLSLAGKTIFYIPNSTVYHVGGATLNKENPRKTFLNFRNNLLMLYKNLPKERLHKVMIARWFLDYLAAWQTLLLHGKLGDFKAIYKARKAFRQMKKEYVSERQRIQENKKGSPMTAHCSIVYRYHIKGERLFSDIRSTIR